MAIIATNNDPGTWNIQFAAPRKSPPSLAIRENQIGNTASEMFQPILRIETTVVNVSFLNDSREAEHKDGTRSMA